ncbi:putative Hydroxysteroid dehydrogenase-like protein 2 [Roridomyces roridus]|uniref:Hydroxysteroid dehydrogenase-like protein 2 n=1 Tax=Roridomyces roridus TaxID=1738132 RepID=A0AAD7BM26_9AGAR|nr:putative Hydroxysteroid dehydrogenase-like protein 2 [Roridomyces roridus]
MSHNNKKPVALVVGASRGMGRQIAIDLARNGYAVVVTGKSVSDASKVTPFPPNPDSDESTTSTVVREIREAGREAHAIAVDVRDAESVKRMVDGTVEKYGSLDVLVYNSGAIWWAAIEDTPLKRFQLMQKVNPEGLYATIQAALPHFKAQGWKARIIVVSPPIYSRFFRGKTAYAMGKVGMSVLTKGLAMDFERQGRKDMAITSIWPAAALASAATIGPSAKSKADPRELRKATVFSDAILAMLAAPTSVVNGLLDLDEDFLKRHAGVTNFDKYNLVEGANPRRIMPAEFPDLRVKEQDDEGKRIDLAKAKL